MKFNHEDLMKGNISYEQTLSIINYVVYNRIKSELDNKFYKEEDLKITANWLLETARGTIIFKTSVDPSQEGDKKTFNDKLTTHKRKLYLQRYFKILFLMEHYKVMENIKAKLDYELDRLNELKEKEHDKYLIEEAYQNRLFADRIEMEIQKSKEEVRDYIENLHKSIAIREGSIRAARVYHADRIILQADNIIVNGKEFFEGMDKTQITNFVDGRLAILEFKERRMLELEHERDMALARIVAIPMESNGGQVILQSKQQGVKKNVLKDFNDKKIKLDKEEVANLRRLVQETGCKSIDLNVDDKAFMHQFHQYDHHHIVKAEQEKFVNVVKQEYSQILLENDIADAGEAVRDKIYDIKERDAQIRELDEFLKKTRTLKIANDIYNLDVGSRELDLGIIRVNTNFKDSRVGSKETDSNLGSELRNVAAEALNSTQSGIELKDSDKIMAAISSLDTLDLEAFDIEFDNQHNDIQVSISEIGAASIDEIDSMDEINFSNLRVPSTTNKVIEDETRTSKRNSI